MRESEFMVGDCVIIKDADFLKTQRDVGPRCVSDMWRFAGKVAEITSVSYTNVYGLSVDGKDTGYSWDENWFDPIQEINGACLAEFDSLL